MSEIFLFFEERFELALKNQKKYVPDDLKIYILDLLEKNMTDMFSSSGERIYLFDLYQDSLSGNKQEREVKLKKLGDYTIITLGCFTSNALNSVNGIDYYVSMGRSAYSSAQVVSDKEIYHKANIYYLDLISILNEAYESCSYFDKKDMYKIYEAWQSTKSIPMGNFLIRNGISIIGCKS